MPREAIAYVAAGESMQARAAALEQLSRGDSGPLTAVWRACVDRLSYLVCVLLVLSLIVMFMLIRIVPQFQMIFDDFGFELPALTRAVVTLSQFMARYLAAPFGLFVTLSGTAAIVTAILYLVDIPILQPLGDWLFRRRRTADALRILAIAAEGRQSLATALDRLARVYPSRPIRARLARAAAAVTAGKDWRQALADARVIRPAEQALLSTAEQVGNLPWALRAIAERREKRATYRLAAAVQVVYPCGVLLLAACIGCFVVAMFVPLIELINSLV